MSIGNKFLGLTLAKAAVLGAIFYGAKRLEGARGVEVSGKNVLITGAGSGIGKLMALECARSHAGQVFVWDISKEGGQATVAEIEELGGQGAAWQVDVTDPEQIEIAASEVLEIAGQVDILINCAGIVSGKEFLDITDEDLRRIYDINTLALYRVTRQFLPAMLEQDAGAIINIASAAGLIGVPKQSDYSGTKAAALMMTESLRQEMLRGGHNIHVMAVCPYYISTGMFEGVRTKFPALLPILDPDMVAKRILLGLNWGEKLLVLPPFAKLVMPMRILPVSIFDYLANFFGLTHGMDEFKGRGAQDAPGPRNNK